MDLKNSHHPYAEMAMRLKEKGYKQQIYVGDNLYLTLTKDYITVKKDVEVNDNYVRIPKLGELFGEVTNYNYMIEHTFINNKDKYILTCSDLRFEDENIWMTLCNLWLSKRG